MTTESTDRVVTEASWRPGLPPPIKALEARFRPDDGWVIEYGTWVEPLPSGGIRTIPVATVTGSDGKMLRFFPSRPKVLDSQLPSEAPSAGHLRASHDPSPTDEGGREPMRLVDPRE